MSNEITPGTVTVLPDGSACFTMSFPLPKDHWLYAERRDDEIPSPHLPLTLERVVAAAKFAVRGATDCGRIQDFDPDALVQNMVCAMLGSWVDAPRSISTDRET